MSLATLRQRLIDHLEPAETWTPDRVPARSDFDLNPGTDRPERMLRPAAVLIPVIAGPEGATVLRKDDDGYVLVTPGEKLSITVEDLPFRAVAVERRGEALVFTTDVGDETEAGPEHPIRVDTDPESGEPSPSVHVRADLWARIARPVFYELVEMAGVEDGRLTVRSDGVAFALGPVGAGVE